MAPNVILGVFITFFLVQFTKQYAINQNELSELKRLEQLLTEKMILQLQIALNSNDFSKSVDMGEQLQKELEMKKKRKPKMKHYQKPIQHRLFIG